MPLVTDAGFAPIPEQTFAPFDGAAEGVVSENEMEAVDMTGGDDPAALRGAFDRIALIRVAFPSFADGRGFSVARRLRDLGYRGRLRAHGHVICEQYRYARLCGFDEVEIDDALAARQPETEWRAAGRPAQNYRRKTRAATDI